MVLAIAVTALFLALSAVVAIGILWHYTFELGHLVMQVLGLDNED
jgi:hypothetical protein